MVYDNGYERRCEGKAMTNIIDYATQETADFAERPYNEVDALVLASLCYEHMPANVPTYSDVIEHLSTPMQRLRSLTPFNSLDPRRAISHIRSIFRAPFNGPTLTDIGKELGVSDFNSSTGDVSTSDPELTLKLFVAAVSNPRFNTIRVSAYHEYTSIEEQTQFAAMTMLRPDGVLVVLFRGTDDTFVGWKEDFNMSYQYPVPSQESAAEYLRQIAQVWKRPLVLAGHSKGGNLAVYAAMHSPEAVRARIISIYNFDGPGFPEPVFASAEYQDIAGRVVKFVPGFSIVGMILDAPDRCIVVDSDENGFMQHVAFSWRIKDGKLARRDKISAGSQYFSQALEGWLAQMTKEELEHTIDALFALIMSTGTECFGDMVASLPRKLPQMLGSFVGLSDTDRRHIMEGVTILWQALRGQGK